MWVFGYGSLIWKVDFPYEYKITGHIEGFQRRFWQASIDHRGTPEKPGRVVTLVETNNLQDKVWGVGYKIRDADVNQVRRHLDHREKNGYTLQQVRFHPRDPEHQPFHLGIYIADPNNPSFLGDECAAAIARQIYASRGASGANIEYLFNLAEAHKRIAAEHQDQHLYELERHVREMCDQLGTP